MPNQQRQIEVVKLIELDLEKRCQAKTTGSVVYIVHLSQGGVNNATVQQQEKPERLGYE